MEEMMYSVGLSSSQHVCVEVPTSICVAALMFEEKN